MVKGMHFLRMRSLFLRKIVVLMTNMRRMNMLGQNVLPTIHVLFYQIKPDDSLDFIYVIVGESPQFGLV